MAKGYLITQVFTAREAIPIENASVLVTKRNGTGDDLLGFQFTNSSGETRRIEIETPEIGLSQEPGNVDPFTVVDIRIEHPSYYPITIHDAQVFANTTTDQRTEMIPVADILNPVLDGAEYGFVTPQNL